VRALGAAGLVVAGLVVAGLVVAGLVVAGLVATGLVATGAAGEADPVTGAAAPTVVPPPAQPAAAASPAAITRIRIFTVAPPVCVPLLPRSMQLVPAWLPHRSLTANGRKVLRPAVLSGTDSTQSRCKDSWRT
jgi:hypothetical protein